MDGEHLHIELHGGRHRLRNRIGDVVKFQVEKHAGTGGANALHDVRTGGGEQLAANLERADGRRDLFREFQSPFRVRHIERGDDWIAHGLNIKPPASEQKPKSDWP